MTTPRTAVYAGSFDPLTNGHVDVVERGRRIFDKLIIAVARNISKKPLFDTQERIEIIEAQFADDPGVTVETFDGLLVEFAKQRGCCAILRGLRGVSDFEYELRMANMNRKLNEDIETVFLMTEGSYFYVSSRLVKEVASLGGDVTGLVPDHVIDQLNQKYHADR